MHLVAWDSGYIGTISHGGWFAVYDSTYDDDTVGPTLVVERVEIGQMEGGDLKTGDVLEFAFDPAAGGGGKAVVVRRNFSSNIDSIIVFDGVLSSVPGGAQIYVETEDVGARWRYHCDVD